MTVVMRTALAVGVLVSAVAFQPALAADPGSPPGPAGIAVDTQGNVYVSDYTQDRIVKFGPDGSVLTQWGGSGSAPGQFNAPYGLALDDHNTLFVVDQLNNRVQRFGTDGTPLSAWGSAGAGSSDLRTPFGVAVGNGHVYVADFGNDRVQVYSAEGGLSSTVGTRGSADGQFQRPAGVALDHDGALYVTDHFNDRIERFSAEGRFQAQLGTAQAGAPGTPTPMSGAPAPATGTAVPTVTVSPQASAAPSIGPSRTVVDSGLSDAQLKRPEGIVVDHEGNVWVADYGRDRVVKFAPDGHLLLSRGNTGSGSGEFVGPKGVAIDPSSGHLYVADAGNSRIQRLAPDGTPEAAWPLPAPPAPSALSNPSQSPDVAVPAGGGATPPAPEP